MENFIKLSGEIPLTPSGLESARAINIAIKNQAKTDLIIRTTNQTLLDQDPYTKDPYNNFAYAFIKEGFCNKVGLDHANAVSILQNIFGKYGWTVGCFALSKGYGPIEYIGFNPTEKTQ